MAWVEILPGFEKLFRDRGWESAAPFLAWRGILINRHRDRQVEEVAVGPEPDAQARDDGASLACASGSETRFYLKKERAVSWRERFHNAWDGFGWCATAVREAVLLQALRTADVGCPEVAAFGEAGCEAFVLLREAAGMTELRAFLPTLNSDEERHRLADALGRELARMHDTGFVHPDLFAKHILAGRAGNTFRFCILDWQRGQRRRRVPWQVRCRDLAVLDATLMDVLASDRLRLRCRRAYCAAQADRPASADLIREGEAPAEPASPARQEPRPAPPPPDTGYVRPPLRRLARRIRRQAEQLRGRRHIREIGQLPVPARDQQLVPVQEGRLLIVRSFYDRLGEQLPDWLAALSEPEAQARGLTLTLAQSSGADGTWEMPPLAHTLFRLQRFGVPAPRLLAVGCSASRVFLLAEPIASIPFEEAFAKAAGARRRQILEQAGRLVRQIHEAGYYLPRGNDWARRLGVARASGDVVLARVEPLPRGTTSGLERAPAELSFGTIRLSHAEHMRFLQAYLQSQGRHDRAWTPERRVAS